MTEGPIKGRRSPTPDPIRRPAPGVGKLRENVLSGHGSPEGQVAAGAGTVWQDTDPAGSGSVYRKTTPSGTTGWSDMGAAGGGGGSDLTWTAIPSAWFGPGVTLAAGTAPVDPYFAYDTDFLYMRGSLTVTPATPNQWFRGGGLSTLSSNLLLIPGNNATYFHAPIPFTGGAYLWASVPIATDYGTATVSLSLDQSGISTAMGLTVNLDVGNDHAAVTVSLDAVRMPWVDG